MGQRSTRVNELVKREISSILHTDYRDVAVSITVSRVSIAPDLRSGVVYYSVIGGDQEVSKARSLLGKIGRDLQRKAFRTIVLKYSPQLRFEYDLSLAEVDRVFNMLDEIERESGPVPGPDDRSADK